MLADTGITLSPDDYIFIAEAEDSVEDDIGEEDASEPVSKDSTVAAAGLLHHGHIHRHQCRRIEATVNFQTAKSRKFAPSARIGRVRRWAFRAFNLSGPAASDFYCGSAGRIGGLVQISTSQRL